MEELWERVLAGRVDSIASDHSPSVTEDKTRYAHDVWAAWGGIPGLQTMLPLLLTEGVQRRGMPLPLLVRLTSTNPARQFGLYPYKGSLQPGYGYEASDPYHAFLPLALRIGVDASEVACVPSCS